MDTQLTLRPPAGRVVGFEVLDSSPIGPEARDSTLYSELWSKMRWAIGNTLMLTYGKHSKSGEIARRCCLVVLANYNEGYFAEK